MNLIKRFTSLGLKSFLRYKYSVTIIKETNPTLISVIISLGNIIVCQPGTTEYESVLRPNERVQSNKQIMRNGKYGLFDTLNRIRKLNCGFS